MLNIYGIDTASIGYYEGRLRLVFEQDTIKKFNIVIADDYEIALAA